MLEINILHSFYRALGWNCHAVPSWLCLEAVFKPGLKIPVLNVE